MRRTALTAAEDAFRMLVRQPAPLAFDARPITGLPDRHLPLDELRDLLLAPGVDSGTSDAVCRQLAEHTRNWQKEWGIAALGIALPGLTRLAARLSAGCAKLAEDIDSEVLTGFLHLLRTGDLRGPKVWLRLCWAAWRAGYAARQVEDLLELPPDIPVGSRTPYRPYGHPDLILGRAVAAGFITSVQADLIGSTRLDDVLIEHIAAECGLSGSVVRMRRKRAERKLIDALQRGELGGVVVVARSAGDRAVVTGRHDSLGLAPRRARAAVRAIGPPRALSM